VSGNLAQSAFAIGTGRCGTAFVARLLALEEGVAAHHESHPFNEAFRRYCLWNHLPVDARGFLDIKRRELEQTHISGKVFFEASAYLSLSVLELHETFGSRFVLLVRDPIDTINSLWVKGWYEEDYRKDAAELAVGFHDLGPAIHFFSRLVPKGDDFRRWSGLSRVGKLAWYWATLHDRILAQLSKLPPDAWTMVRLEELDFAEYQRVARFVGAPGALNEQRFTEIVHERPGALWRRRQLDEWTTTEVNECAAAVEQVATILGYDTDVMSRWVRHQKRSTGARALQPLVANHSDRDAPIALGPHAQDAWIKPGSLLFTLPTGSDWLEQAAWALRQGIDGFRIDAAHVPAKTVRALWTTIPKSASRSLVVIDAASEWREWQSAAQRVGISCIHVAAPAERAAHLDGTYPWPGIRDRAIPRMMSLSAVIRWHELLGQSPVILLSWPHLLRSLSEDDLEYWLGQHYEQALTRRISLILELDELAGDLRWEGLIVWALRRGLSLCASGSSASSTWQAVVSRVVSIRDEMRIAGGSESRPAASFRRTRDGRHAPAPLRHRR